jgi:hypothetical protein
MACDLFLSAQVAESLPNWLLSQVEILKKINGRKAKCLDLPPDSKNTGTQAPTVLRRRSSTSKSGGRYEPSPTDFISSFYAVLNRWRSETAFESDPDRITAHSSFAALVRHADLVCPLIIQELRMAPSKLVWVLDDAFPHEIPYGTPWRQPLPYLGHRTGGRSAPAHRH